MPRVTAGIRFLVWLSRRFRPPRFVTPTEEVARKTPAEKEADELAYGAERLRALGDPAALAGRVLLDLGCGAGIKTAAYAAGAPTARLVVGMDRDEAAVARAAEAARRRGGRGPAFLVADAAALPLREGCVDLLLSENAFEHIPDVAAALRETARVLRTGGRAALQFFPLYYSRYGSHLWDYLPIPWVHVWASPGTVFAAFRRRLLAEVPRLRRELRGVVGPGEILGHLRYSRVQFLTLNRLTPARFYRLVSQAGEWRLEEFDLHGTPRLEKGLALVPGLERFMLWGIACVLRREPGARVAAGEFRRRMRSQILIRFRQFRPGGGGRAAERGGGG